MNNIFRGNAWVDTDIIIPSSFLVTDDEKELGAHVFSDLMPGFSSRISQGDILVAGRNFGCGSSREHAPLAIRGSGISCVVAESYARTFFRNCINRGFYAVELPDASKRIRQRDVLEININKGIIINRTSSKEYAFTPFPAFVQEICKQKGLFPYIQERLNATAKRGYERE
jgi:3-isopropylmalate/(R)-2-methylmalate dehydratase small subunit